MPIQKIGEAASASRYSRCGVEVQGIQRLMQNSRNIPMLPADACMIGMAEIHENSKVLMLDSDFVVYRKSGRRLISLLRPDR